MVEIHLHHQLLAGILSEWAESIADEPLRDEGHRKTLVDALKKLQKTLSSK